MFIVKVPCGFCFKMCKNLNGLARHLSSCPVKKARPQAGAGPPTDSNGIVSSASPSDSIHAVPVVTSQCVSNTPCSILTSGMVACGTLDTDVSTTPALVGSVRTNPVVDKNVS